MLRARLLLTLFTTVFGTLAILAFGSPLNLGVKFLATGAASIVAVSGLTVLTFTLFGARIAPDGSVCFSKNHPIHWLTIANLENGTSLCGTTWGTVVPITLVAFACTIVFAVIFGTVRAAQEGRLVENLRVMGFIAAVVLSLAAVCALAEYLIKKYGSERFKKILGRVAFGLVILLFLFLLVVGVPKGLQDEAARKGELITYGQAAWQEVLIFAYAFGGLGAIVGLVWLGFKVVPFLAATGFGRFIKQNLCPVVRTCPVDGGDCPPAPQAA